MTYPVALCTLNGCDIVSSVTVVFDRLLVRLDDALIKHLLHESSYVIEFKPLPGPGQGCDVTLIESDD